MSRIYAAWLGTFMLCCPLAAQSLRERQITGTIIQKIGDDECLLDYRGSTYWIRGYELTGKSEGDSVTVRGRVTDRGAYETAMGDNVNVALFEPTRPASPVQFRPGRDSQGYGRGRSGTSKTFFNPPSTGREVQPDWKAWAAEQEARFAKYSYRRAPRTHSLPRSQRYRSWMQVR